MARTLGRASVRLCTRTDWESVDLFAVEPFTGWFEAERPIEGKMIGQADRDAAERLEALLSRSPG